MSSLELLPNEISTEIMSYLPVSDLVSTSRVSRRMKSVAQPVLFKAPDVINDGDFLSSSFLMLLRTLLSPGGAILATFVRSLHTEFVQFGWMWLDNNPLLNDGDDEEDEQQRSDLALLTAAATRFENVNLNSSDGHLMLLLHHLPRLHTLRITVSHELGAPYCRFLRLLGTGIDNLPLGLQQLSEFRCSGIENYGSIGIGALLNLLSLPHIRKIDARIISDPPTGGSDPEIALASSTVTDLRLSEMLHSQGYLEFLLARPAALEYFSYSCHVYNDAVEIRQTLQPLKMSLKYLQLGDLQVTKPIGSLRDWPLLQTLRCSLTVLLGEYLPTGTLSLADVLPAGLRVFHIYRDSEWPVMEEIAKVMELLPWKMALLPRLEIVIVAVSHAQMPEDEWDRDTLRKACLGVGVELRRGETDMGRRYVGASDPGVLSVWDL